MVTPPSNTKQAVGLFLMAHAVQVNGPPARGPDHFPFQGFRDSGIGSQGITNSLAMMCKTKTTVINMPAPTYTLG